MDIIENVIGKANNLCESRIRQFLPKDKQRWADHVDESITPIKDWVKVSIRGANKINPPKVNGDLISLFSKFWFIEIVVIKRRKAINRWPITVWELSECITVKAPNEPWTKTKNSKNE